MIRYPPPVSYTATFDKNGGDTYASPTTKTVTVPATTIDALPIAPTWTLGIFSGWNTKADGSGTVFTASTPVTKDITVYAQWQYFKFTVRTTGANEKFYIPTSGQLNGSSGKPYKWTINWGDTTPSETKNGTSANASPGIEHEYLLPREYHITITPAGSLDAWLGAFGFLFGSSGANATANKNRVISVDSPLTLLMTRTQAEITEGTAPTYEWAYTFYFCQNQDFTMGTQFKFAAEWDTVTTVGDYFAYQMFSDCSGTNFNMSSDFNLPQGIKTVGYCSTQNMFSGCNGSNFQVNSVFKFPRLTTTELGKYYVYYATFALGTGAAIQTRTAASIINGNSNPTTDKNTFGPNWMVWSDYNLIYLYWREGD